MILHKILEAKIGTFFILVLRGLLLLLACYVAGIAWFNYYVRVLLIEQTSPKLCSVISNHCYSTGLLDLTVGIGSCTYSNLLWGPSGVIGTQFDQINNE